MNGLPLKALCCHGIQSSVGDWKQVEDYIGDKISIEHAGRLFLNQKRVEPNIWEDSVVEHEATLLRDNFHTLLITHSFATHRVGKILEKHPDIYGAILMNPPLNVMQTGNKTVNRVLQRENGFMDMLFRNVAFDMTDNDYDEFLERQAQTYAKESNEISRQGGILKRGKPFLERLSEIPQEFPLLIIQASGDPWNVDQIPETEKRTVVDFGPECGHYPHISRPKEVADLIRSWVFETLLATESEVGTVAYGYSSHDQTY